jgi:hypothetical protein
MSNTSVNFIIEQILIHEALIADIERRRPDLLQEDYSPTLEEARDLQQLRSLRSSLQGLVHLFDQKALAGGTNDEL